MVVSRISFQILLLLQVSNDLGWFINPNIESQAEIMSGELSSPWVCSCLWM